MDAYSCSNAYLKPIRSAGQALADCTKRGAASTAEKRTSLLARCIRANHAHEADLPRRLQLGISFGTICCAAAITCPAHQWCNLEQISARKAFC